MIYTIILSPWFLLTSSALVLVTTLGLFGFQLDFLVTHYQMDFVPGEIGLEEKITILAAAYGFFLEHLGWAAKRRFPENVPPATSDLCEMSERTGIWMILLAVTMEVIDLGFVSANQWFSPGPEIKFAEVMLMFVLNGVFLFFLADFFRNVLSHPGHRQDA